MKIRMLSKKPDRIEFVLEDATPAFANALRRIMISEIPTMTISWTDISANNSALYDEIIANRLGMIPLRFDPRKFKYEPEKAKGKKEEFDAMFALEKTGPCMVYSSDMKPSNKAVVPTDPKFLIVELLDKQRIKLEAYAKLGFGRDHAKNQAAIASYQYYPEVRKAHDGEKCEACPAGLVDMSGKKPEIADWTKADIEGGKCMAGDYVVELSDKKFLFRVETASGLLPEDIVLSAADILQEKASEFEKQLKDI